MSRKSSMLMAFALTGVVTLALAFMSVQAGLFGLAKGASGNDSLAAQHDEQATGDQVQNVANPGDPQPGTEYQTRYIYYADGTYGPAPDNGAAVADANGQPQENQPQGDGDSGAQYDIPTPWPYIPGGPTPHYEPGQTPDPTRAPLGGQPPALVPTPTPRPQTHGPTPTPHRTPAPQPQPAGNETPPPTAAPTPVPVPIAPEPTHAPQPHETQEPQETPEPHETQEPHETAEPHETQEPHETDEPHETQEPRETPEPHETEEPEQHHGWD